MPMKNLLCSTAAGQHGLLMHDQLSALGFSNDAIAGMVASGWLEKVERGLYLVAGAPRTWRQQLRAGVFSGGEQAVASHEAAAALWQLPGFPEGPVEVSTPFGCDHKYRRAWRPRPAPQ